MANHRVQGVPVLPGMAALAMLAAAAREQGFDGPLEEIAWIRPVAAPTAVRVTSTVEGDELALRLVDREGAGIRPRHGAARAVAGAARSRSRHAHGEDRQRRSSRPRSAPSSSRPASSMAAAFRLLAGIDLHEGWLLARLEPGRPEAWAPLESGPVSPAVLDSALQALAAHACGVVSGATGDGRPFLPAGVGRFVCHWSMEGELVARIVVDPAATDAARLTADLRPCATGRTGGGGAAGLRGAPARACRSSGRMPRRAASSICVPSGSRSRLPDRWAWPPVSRRHWFSTRRALGAWASGMARESGGRALAAERSRSRQSRRS